MRRLRFRFDRDYGFSVRALYLGTWTLRGYPKDPLKGVGPVEVASRVSSPVLMALRSWISLSSPCL